MTESKPARYSRDSAVSAVRDFYLFLTRLPRISSSDIKDALEGGWPELDDDALSKLAKSDAVNDLIRHLPYISSDGKGNNMIAPETWVTQYTGSSTRWSMEKGVIKGILTPYDAGNIPAHVAVLTGAGRYGSWLLLDTEAGTVTDYIQFERPERSTPDSDSPDFWRAYRTLPIADFFEEWKDNYRQLAWVVVPEDADDGVIYRFDKETDEVREIYRQHGWPDSFRRDECRQVFEGVV